MMWELVAGQRLSQIDPAQTVGTLKTGRSVGSLHPNKPASSGTCSTAPLSRTTYQCIGHAQRVPAASATAGGGDSVCR
jgi:hypothetical protein